MSDNSFGQYDSQILFLKRISDFKCLRLGIKVDIEVDEEEKEKLGAEVKHKHDNEYQVTLFSESFNLQDKIEAKTPRFDYNDAILFKPVISGLFAPLKDDPYSAENYRDTLNKLFGSLILLHVYLHELNHIKSGHFDKVKELRDEIERTGHGSYETQEYEMIADWYSTKDLFCYLCGIVIRDRYILDEEEFEKQIRIVTILYWITMAIECQIIKEEDTEKHLIRKTPDGEPDYSLLKHPHPSVRLYYNIDAMREGIADIYEIYFGYDDDNAEAKANEIFKEQRKKLDNFRVVLKDLPIIQESEDIKTSYYYILLRDTSSRLRAQSDGLHHLCDLPDEYFEGIEIINKLLNGEPLE